MADVLKGNFKTKRAVERDPESNARDKLVDEFEKTAESHLAGSIAFVTRKGFLWTGSGDRDARGEG
jgi:hypothetical protein